MLIAWCRITEEILHESIDARTEILSSLRELGPPDLVQLIKQAPRNPGKQVRFDLVGVEGGLVLIHFRLGYTTMLRELMRRRLPV